MTHRPWEISHKIAREFNLSKYQIKHLNNLNKEQYSNNAWHEAAHAVVGYQLGVTTEFIDLTPRIDKIENGVGSFTVGQIKQSEFKSFKTKAQEGDSKAQLVIGQHIVSQMAGVVFDLWNGQFGGGVDMMAAVQAAMHMFKGNTDKCSCLIQKCAVLAGRILDANTAYLTVLADELYKEKMLIQSEIESILSKKLESSPMGIVEYSDIAVEFHIDKGMNPRFQIGMFDCGPSKDYLSFTQEPPFDFFVYLDETIVAEMIQ